MMKKFTFGFLLVLLTLSLIAPAAFAADDVDLAVSEFSVQSETDNDVTLFFEITNLGTDTVESGFQVTIETISEETDIVENTATFISIVDLEQDETLSFTTTQDRLPEETQYLLTADSSGIVEETDETNNRASVEVDELPSYELAQLQSELSDLEDIEKDLKDDFDDALAEDNFDDIEEIEDDVEDLLDEVFDLQDEIEELLDEVEGDDIESDVEDLLDDAHDLENDVEDLLEEVEDALESGSIDTEIEITDVVVTPSTTITAGNSFLVQVLLENVGEEDAEDVKVTAELAALSISAVEFVDEIDVDDTEDIPDMFLPVGKCTDAGDYDITVTVEGDNFDQKSSVTAVAITANSECETSGNETTLSPQEQKLEDLKDEFKGYEDDFDDIEDDLDDAKDDNDKSDIEDAEDDFDDLDKDLDDFKDDVKDFEDDIEDDDTLDAQTQDDILDEIEDLLDDIDDLRDDIDYELNGPKVTGSSAIPVTSYSQSSTSQPTSSGSSNTASDNEPVTIQYLNTALTGNQPAVVTEPASMWDDTTMIALAVAGVVILLALVVFLIALLMR